MLPLPTRSKRHSASVGASIASDESPIPSIRTPPSSSVRRAEYGPANASLLAPVSQNESQGPIYQFDGRTYPSANLEFTFRSLHNTSPQPPKRFATPAGSPPATPPSRPSSSSVSPALQKYKGIETRVRQDSGLFNKKPVFDFGKISLPLMPISTPEPHSSPPNPSPQIKSETPRPDEEPHSQERTIYDVRDETAPTEPFYTVKFQSALQRGRGIAREATAALATLDTEGSEWNLERLKDNAEALSKFQGSDTRTIAVLGASGEGKSSLINSLLHYPEIARTGDTGSACTSVVTEYRQRSDHHTSPITIEVEYLSDSEIRDLITELVWNYRKLYLPGVEADTIPAEEYERYRRESDLALSTLEAAFKHRREFKPHLLNDMSDGAIDKITRQLIGWTEDLEWPDGDGNSNGLWKSTAKTADECSDKTAAFMKDRLWPFTKIIRVYLSSQVLKTGIILADLPGLQDTNLARMKVTQDYLLRCDHIFIVAKISRAVTDQSLKSSLYQVLSKHVPLEWETTAGKYLNLAVVCTNTEDINEAAARREFCGPGKHISHAALDTIDKEIQRVKELKDRKTKKLLERRRRFMFVDARNNHVKEGLQNAYAAKVPGGTLEVFCVSNSTYEKYTGKGDIEMVNASGIPGLRRFCYAITAQAQLLEARHFLQSRLGSLLNSIQIWVDGHQELSQPRSHDVEESLNRSLEELSAAIAKIFDGTKVKFIDAISEQVLQFTERRSEHWEKAAKLKGEEWCNWHWTQYKAWCRHNGDHYTEKRGAVNWNQDIIWKMRSELDYQWDILEEEIPEIFDSLLRSIEEKFESLKSTVEELRLPVELNEGINLQLELFRYALGLSRQDFAREMKTIRRKASEGNAGSYIKKEMTPSYRLASGESGAGMAARQIRIVQGHITSETLFPNISVAIEDHFSGLVKTSMKNLKKKVLACLALVRYDLELAATSGNVSNVGEEKLEQARVRLVDLLRVFKEKHEELVNDIISVT